jgi:hypothetical protein
MHIHGITALINVSTEVVGKMGTWKEDALRATTVIYSYVVQHCY